MCGIARVGMRANEWEQRQTPPFRRLRMTSFADQVAKLEDSCGPTEILSTYETHSWAILLTLRAP